MKAITIIQPWATLIAIGAKKYETRGWATKHRGPLAVHAGKKIDWGACEREPIKSTLARFGYNALNLPKGVIVATAIVNDCNHVSGNFGKEVVLFNGNSIIGEELSFGNYSQGRYAWELADVQPLHEPIPAKGRQGLWNWDGGFI